MIRKNWSAFFLTLGLAFVTPANAENVSYAFSVYWYTGALAGTQSFGTFSYDSSIIQPNKTINDLSILSQFSFNLREFTYDVSKVKSSYISFDSAGNLSNILFGNNCYAQSGNAASCGVASDQRDQFLINYDINHPTYVSVTGDGDNPFIYPGTSYGATNVTQIASVPEPTSALMLLVGMSFFWMTHRKT